MGLGKNKKKADNAAEASSALSSSFVAKTPKSLKAKAKIIKKTPNENSAKTIQDKIIQQAKASSVPSSSGTKTPNIVKPGTKIVKKSSNQNSAKKSKINVTRVQDKSKHEKKCGQDLNKEASSNNHKNDEKKPKSFERDKKNPQNENFVKTKDANEKRPRDYKGKEKLGGLILMCNGKTKPDCFHFGVMGVPLNKKELVLAIKPGLKLFLYDFDLRLLYGIYRASSPGGMKLEPNAFDGAFPVQVRFKVHKDCFPLPEDVFKQAIKDNYSDKKQRFKTELTVQQVKKLIDLFKPVQQQQSNPRSFVQAAAPTLFVHPAPMPDRREPQSRINRKQFSRNRSSPKEERSYYRPSDQERGRFLRHHGSTHRDITSGRKEIFSDDSLFLSEKEYRTYGLGRAEHATTSPIRIPSSEPYHNDPRREQPRTHPSSIHRDTLMSHKEELSSDPLFLSEKAYRTYGLGRDLPVLSTPPAPYPNIHNFDLYSKDSNYSYPYNASSSDPYTLLTRRDAISSESYPPLTARETHIPNYEYLQRGGITDHSLRRETDDGYRTERLYSHYASTSMSDYNERQHLGGTADHAAGTVSSKYSFPGPSVIYR